MLAVVWALEKCSFYTKGAPLVTIFSDHSALASLQKKDLVKVPNQRLVRMLEKISGFNTEIRYIPGGQNR